MILVSRNHPHGDWDAWAIWNNRARFLFRAGSHWGISFSPLLDWSHPDYPLLLPLSIARCWFYLGAESLWVPAVMALLFSVSVTLLLVSSLSTLRNKSQGYWSGIILLSTPSFLIHSASQYADIPLAFFFLSAVAALLLQDTSPSPFPRLLVLSGLMAGFSAWTKNEGLVFVVLLFLIRFVGIRFPKDWKENWKEGAFFMAGLLPVLAVIVPFKRFLAPSNYLFSPRRGRSNYYESDRCGKIYPNR